MLVAGALTSAQAPPNFTPDAFVTQVTSSSRTSATNPVASFAGDTSANGRFVVIESNGDIATEKTASRNNQDGNREIFLFDYAQRRIFQITNTRSVLKPAGSPSPSPSPSPSVSPTASPTPPVDEPANVKIEISNNRPMISLEPALAAGNRTYTIVFSSNVPVTPASFDGTDPGTPTNTDMNQEVWTYRFTVADTFDLSTGAEIPFADLSTGAFTRISNTPASRAPSPGSTGIAPFVADDNRDAQISDDGEIIVFTSTRDIVAGGNVDTGSIPNPEIFLFNRNTSGFTQVTNTISPPNDLNHPVFNDNPALSGDGSTLTFISDANLTGDNNDGTGGNNEEIYLANFNGTTVSGLRQVTKSKRDASGATVNILTLGRRLSRDGRYIAFESIAADPNTANGPNTSFYVSFVYDSTINKFAQLGPRAAQAPGDPVLHVPVFTDYGVCAGVGPLTPCSVMFTSALNFKSDGTFPASGQESTGLNPNTVSQIFLAPLPVVGTGPFTRMTNFPATGGFSGVGAYPSETRHRFAFSRPSELGGGNADGSIEVFYQLSPNIVTESPAVISLFTGASLIPVSSPTASPAVSPNPYTVPGLAPGELAVAQFTVSPAPTAASVNNNDASESRRSPALPIELNGTSVSINGAACGLYAVTATSISFVVPKGLAPNPGTTGYPIVINSSGVVLRGRVIIVAAQPDIFTTSNGPDGRAVICNITNPLIAGCLIEPFHLTSSNGTTNVPTVLELHLTGVRGTAASAVTVTIGTTVIVPTNVISLDQPGFDTIIFKLPTMASGDYPIVVRVGTASSRPDSTAPHVTIINP